MYTNICDIFALFIISFQTLEWIQTTELTGWIKTINSSEPSLVSNELLQGHYQLTKSLAAHENTESCFSCVGHHHALEGHVFDT